jgi:polygalacturonase
MMNLLFSGSSSACLELVNEASYFAPESFTVFLNGQEQYSCNKNVFSLFSLRPDTEYTVTLQGKTMRESLRFRTRTESCALDVRSFGAAGDGEHDDTCAIQTAIGCLPAGGRLLFPAGRYLSRPLMLKSHITLEFAEGATLLGWTEREDYPVIPGTVSDLSGRECYFGGFEGNAVPMYQSLITGQYAEDIAIVGKGMIDGNAQNSDFWVGFNQFPAARPRLMFFNRCRNITVHGVHICNSPSWQLHPFYSEKIGIYDIQISAPKNSPNTDAIDPESCDGVEIIGCRFSVGDDCIAIKSGKIDLGTKLNRSANAHVIRNCLMDNGHGAITLGSEIGAGVRNLEVSQCWFRGTDRGLRIKSRRGRGKNCRIDGVTFENIRMEGVLTPIVINLWYNCCDPDRESEYVWSRECLPVDDRTPQMGSFHFKNLVCTDAEVAACYIDGLPEAPIEEVTIEDVQIGFSPNARPGIPMMENFEKPRCRLGLYLDNVRHIAIKNVKLENVDGEKLIVNHCEKLDQEGLK